MPEGLTTLSYKQFPPLVLYKLILERSDQIWKIYKSVYYICGGRHVNEGRNAHNSPADSSERFYGPKSSATDTYVRGLVRLCKYG